MANAYDKKMKKGRTEKIRVSRNGEEIQAICKLLGLPKKTSKEDLLRAAVVFIMKYHKRSDINLVPSHGKTRQSERNKSVQKCIQEEESILDEQLSSNYPKLSSSFLIKIAGSLQESSSSFSSSDQSGDDLFCSEVFDLKDSEDETAQMPIGYLSDVLPPVQNGNEKAVMMEEGLPFLPPLSSNPSSPFCPLSSNPPSPFPPSPHPLPPFPTLSSHPSSPSYDNQPQPPLTPNTVFFSTNSQCFTSPSPSPSYYIPSPPLHHLPFSSLNSPCLFYSSLLEPVMPGQKERHF